MATKDGDYATLDGDGDGDGIPADVHESDESEYESESSTTSSDQYAIIERKSNVYQHLMHLKGTLIAEIFLKKKVLMAKYEPQFRGLNLDDAADRLAADGLIRDLVINEFPEVKAGAVYFISTVTWSTTLTNTRNKAFVYNSAGNYYATKDTSMIMFPQYISADSEEGSGEYWLVVDIAAYVDKFHPKEKDEPQSWKALIEKDNEAGIYERRINHNPITRPLMAPAVSRDRPPINGWTFWNRATGVYEHDPAGIKLVNIVDRRSTKEDEGKVPDLAVSAGGPEASLIAKLQRKIHEQELVVHEQKRHNQTLIDRLQKLQRKDKEDLQQQYDDLDEVSRSQEGRIDDLKVAMEERAASIRDENRELQKAKDQHAQDIQRLRDEQDRRYDELLGLFRSLPGAVLPGTAPPGGGPHGGGASPSLTRLEGRLQKVKRQMTSIHNEALESLGEKSPDRESETILSEHKSRIQQVLRTDVLLDTDLDHGTEDKIKDLQKLQFRLARRISELVTIRESRKNSVRAPLPEFNGDQLGFRSFINLFDKAVTHFTPANKISALEKSMTGHRKQELISYMQNCATYEDRVKALEVVFGNVDSLIRGQIEKIRDLNIPRTQAQENNNIQIINSFLRWLKREKREELFNDVLRLDCIAKLTELNRKLAKKMNLKTIDNLESYLSEIYQENQADMNYLSSTDSKVSHGGHSGGSRHSESSDHKHGGGNKHSEKIHKNGNVTSRQVSTKQIKVQSGLSCQLCHGDHKTRLCPRLQDKSNEQVRQLIRTLKLCEVCLKDFEPGHKEHCKSTYFNKKHNQVRSLLCGKNKCKSGLHCTVGNNVVFFKIAKLNETGRRKLIRAGYCFNIISL